MRKWGNLCTKIRYNQFSKKKRYVTTTVKTQWKWSNSLLNPGDHIRRYMIHTHQITDTNTLKSPCTCIYFLCLVNESIVLCASKLQPNELNLTQTSELNQAKTATTV